MKKVAIFGASGLLGSELLPYLRKHGYQIITIGRAEDSDYVCNISDSLDVLKNLKICEPDIIFNLSAVTDVEVCQKDPNFAYLINVKVVENIVSYIKLITKKIHFFQISTDHVYTEKGPSPESDVTLLNYYAYSKYTAELVALYVPCTVIRTNFFGKSKCKGRKSFSDMIYDRLKDKEPFYLFKDVFFSPISLYTLCEIICKLLINPPRGIYNIGCKDGISKSEFTVKFANKGKWDLKMSQAVSIDDVDFIHTTRPKDMRLDVTKIEKILGISMPSINTELNRVVGDYNDKT